MVNFRLLSVQNHQMCTSSAHFELWSFGIFIWSFVSRSKTDQVYNNRVFTNQLKFTPLAMSWIVFVKLSIIYSTILIINHAIIYLGTPILLSVQCQFPEYILGVQLPYFPKGQNWFMWSEFSMHPCKKRSFSRKTGGPITKILLNIIFQNFN